MAAPATRGERVHPNVVWRRNVQNQSSRNGARIYLIVVHVTESSQAKGSADLGGVGSWFDNPVAQASAHVCTDGEGNSARYVWDNAKAWHVAYYNPWALGVEQVGRTAQTSWVEDEYRETARWLARWSKLHGVILRQGAVSNGSIVRSGVVRHADLGLMGGGHYDPGAHYDLAHCIHLAGHYRSRI